MENDFDAIDFYNQVAGIYNRDSLPNILNPQGPYQRGWASQVAALNPSQILEIGCGTGRRLNALVMYYDDNKLKLPVIFGIDPAIKMLEKIPESTSSRITLINSDNTKQFADDSFDLVYTSGVLCSVPNFIAASICKEAIRISKFYAFHTDTPKSGPHLNDLDILKYHTHPGLDILYWSTIYPYPVIDEAEHQIIARSNSSVDLPDEVPLRSEMHGYAENWRELMEKRLSK